MPLYANNQWQSQHIEIVGTQEFINRAIYLIDEIWALRSEKPWVDADALTDVQVTKIPQEMKKSVPNSVTAKGTGQNVGQQFLQELDAAGKDIKIKTGGELLCRAMGGEPRYKLLSAWGSGQTDTARIALQEALDKSTYTVQTLAEQLAIPTPGLANYAFTPNQLKALQTAGLTGALQEGIRILMPTKSLGKKRATKQKVVTEAQGDWVKALNKFLSGGPSVFGDVQKVVIARRLEPWLTPGAGCPVTVELNVKSNSTMCALDKTRKERPLAIGLVHEFIHAYYSVTGTRLYGEASLPDEALTTGLPPEQFRPYTENRFRMLWPEKNLDLRLFYSFALGGMIEQNACPHCGTPNALDENIAPKGQKAQYVDKRFCSECGGSLFLPDDLKGILPEADSVVPKQTIKVDI